MSLIKGRVTGQEAANLTEPNRTAGFGFNPYLPASPHPCPVKCNQRDSNPAPEEVNLQMLPLHQTTEEDYTTTTDSRVDWLAWFLITVLAVMLFGHYLAVQIGIH